MRTILALTLVLATTWPLGGNVVVAQDVDCNDFATIDEARAAYYADPSDPNDLDGDDNGLPCEMISSGGAIYDVGEDSAIPSAEESALLQAEDTFTLSISAFNCDTDPGSSVNARCVSNAGTVVTVSLESGSLIGSCTLEPFETPYGGVASVCGVVGVPFNSTLIVAEDLTTLPAGYTAINSPQVFVTTDLIPGGGDQAVINFFNVLQGQERTAVPNQVPESPTAVEEPARDEEVRPAAIHAGSCDDLGRVQTVLSDALPPQGPPVGQRSAIEAETGSTTADVSLDDLIDEDHAIAVLESDDQDAEVIACGDIGGTDDDDGALIIGLQEVDDSDFTGIAYLAYNGSDATLTDVSIFVAEGLASESD